MHQKPSVTQEYRTYSISAQARFEMFSLSKLVVGSSNAKIPQFKQKVSARANRIINDARTYENQNTKINKFYI